MGIINKTLQMVKKTAGKKIVSSGKSKSGNPLFKKTPKNFRIGGDIQPTKNLTRFVKWPKYVRIQRQKRVLMMRLKVPAPLHIFSNTLERDESNKVMKILSKYSPETKSEKKERLQIEAEARKNGNKNE